ncbi:nuclear export mediator factor NEMF-like [Mucor ambiguus]|uniref:Nuclear export mediator factor NEMF-like n=1 Tax=Mucor ambiguus TaxID=91626 RepID=A0A0C9MMK1_9FUNG|nr:nuclear export mediator factor NEMF-like [Mucor ambiguus]
MKQRFNALDVRATVINLRERLIGIRLQNIYDVNNKTFLFKFAKPDDKELVLVESGIRIHTTQFSRDKSVTPTPFCAKLRKHLRTRRVTNVRQLGVDRIVDFEFAGGEMGIGYHIICEFYSSGNIIFTDHEYRILALLRNVPATDTLNIAVGEIYNVQTVLTDFEKVQVDQLRTALRSAGPKDTLKKLLNIKFEYGPAMIEHMILDADLDPNMKVATDFDTSENSPMMQALLEGFNKGDELIESTKNVVPNGYIILLDEKNKPKTESEEQVEIYDEFHPFLYKQFANRQFKEYPTFDKAVDEFFSAIESQKLELKSRRQEEAALKKLEAVRKEQESRVQSLLNQQITNVRKAQLIELNLQMVDAAITIIRNAVASQMDWQDLQDLVKEEKRRENPIAMIIDDLKLATNQLTLVLTDPEEREDSEDSEDEEASEQKSYKVDVDIGLTAFANARKYYEQKKTTATKHEKTIEATSKALKSAERKIRQDLKETKITATINKIRKPFWFEKFLWFISTDGHLVIAGRDMQQNEMLVKRYLLKDDAYVHADLHGAASVIVKNKPNANGQPIPPSTLYQAGIMSVCQSKAWDSKIVTSAYWVYPDQVSKSAPSGEYLTTGSFMIRGKKNFLPPVQLVYGFGYVFKLDESSIGNHVKSQTQQEDGQEEDANAEEITTPSGKADFLDSIEEKEPEEDQTDAAESTEKEAVEASATTSGASTPATNEPNDESASESDSDSDDSSDDEHAFPDTQLESLPVNIEKAQDKDAKADKYDLDDYGHDSDEQNDVGSPSTNGSNTPAKKFITAKERRLMKKNNLTEITDAIKEQQQLQQQQAKQKQTKPKQAPAKPKTVAAPPASTRGKKGKAKKMKDKYADQDEEERQLRMELLAPNKGPQPKGKKAKRDAKAKEDKAALEKERAAKKEADEKARLLKKQQEEEQQEKEHPIETEGVDAKDTETIRQMLKEENITMLEADEIANLSVLDSFTPNPLPEDIIHFAIPVCAPYTAIQKYKYKVKLTPGSLKRGKAIKQAQSVFFNLNEATAREKELIKSVPEMEGINTMMGKVKVSAPNLEASKRKKGGNRR